MRRRPKTSSSPSALTTSEGIVTGLIAGPLSRSRLMLFPDDLAGSITTLVTNPIWTVQTAQSTRAVTVYEDGSGDLKKVKPSAIEAASEIIKKDGVKGLWRGIGPALILVINPIIQASLPQRIQPDGAE